MDRAAGTELADGPRGARPPGLGGPKDARGQVAGFPQVRVVTLTETGTHAQIDAAVDGACCGEPELAIRLAASAAGMLVIMDRGFPGVACGARIPGPVPIC